MKYAIVVLALALAGCEKSTCEVDGKTYQVGEGFPASDGCNTCTCRKDGTAGCTTIACVPVPEPAH